MDTVEQRREKRRAWGEKGRQGERERGEGANMVYVAENGLV